ncbi:hypothetical protein LJB99_05880, partial [Deltaproteobacteria bacterium OttesenSCG-928-K17]|nr:hypothetical protein [Deltaproteobacteria bacterium OttesenSCG-928-K17]
PRNRGLDKIMSTELYPLTLEPLVAEQIWGRSVELPDDGSLPAAFLGVMVMVAANSRVVAGPEAGRSLSYLRQMWGPKLMGSEAGGDYDGPLPVELKLRRTGDTALAVGLDSDSLWHFLAADENSSVNAGFQNDLDFQTAFQQAGDDAGRWSEFMPEQAVESGQNLFLPKFSPLLLGSGLTVAQISRPAKALPSWPLNGPTDEDLKLAAASASPVWLPAPPREDGQANELARPGGLRVSLVTATHLSSAVNPEAATFLWPVAGQGRIRTRGPAPATRLTPGRVVMLPAGLGRYAVESGASVTYLLIEA